MLSSIVDAHDIFIEFLIMDVIFILLSSVDSKNVLNGPKVKLIIALPELCSVIRDFVIPFSLSVCPSVRLFVCLSCVSVSLSMPRACSGVI